MIPVEYSDHHGMDTPGYGGASQPASHGGVGTLCTGDSLDWPIYQLL